MSLPEIDTASVEFGSPVTLENLKDGRLEVMFGHYISAILKDIKDPDTLARKRRKILLDMVFEPQHGRDYAIVDMEMVCSCLAFKSMKTSFFISGSDSTAAMEEQEVEDSLDEPLTRDPVATHAIAMGSMLNGAVDEAFKIELQRVAANIRDPNTEQSTKRKLRVLFSFAPSEMRNYAGVSVAVSSSCSGHNSRLLTSLVISVEDGVITAHERYVEQGKLF
ncbi:MAG: hypothetical protein AAGB19_01535 [Cyanobacteria bacterium P01_F01_bin.3]